MSRLAGYALPGAVMVLFGAKWSWSAAGEAGGPRKRPCASACPLEGLVKMCAGGVGVVASLVAAYPDGSVEYMGDALHATIYLFFALSGLADVASHYAATPPSRHAARLAFPLAFAVEGALLLLTLPQPPSPLRRPLQLVVGAAWGCGVAVAAHATRPTLAAARALAALVHGTWFVHAGLLAGREEELGPGAVWTTVAFAWHVAAALATLLVLSVARRWCSSAPPAPPEFDAGPPRPPHGPCPFCDGLGGHHQGPC